MRNITPELLEEIKQKIVKAINPEKIILFGSYAWGSPTESSDLDLYIIVSEAGTPAYKKSREVYRALRGTNVPIDVVVQTHDQVESSKRVMTSLAKKVIEEGIVLYG